MSVQNKSHENAVRFGIFIINLLDNSIFNKSPNIQHFWTEIEIGM